MTRNKFLLVLQYIRCEDKATQTQRRGTDKFAAIEELYESVMLNCQKAFFPHANVTIDEQLFPCCSQCSCIQHSFIVLFKLFLILEKVTELKKVLTIML